MKKFTRKHGEVAQFVGSILVVLLGGFEMIGKPARLVLIITLFAGSVALGVSIGMYIERKRVKRANEIAQNKTEPLA